LTSDTKEVDMNALLVYPRFPDTFWGFRRALDLVGLKAGEPPLGLLTVAAMLPPAWAKRLVDENVESLTDDDLAWADVVLVSGMIIQRDSAQTVIDRARAAGRLVVGGGPLFNHHLQDRVDHCLIGEAEKILPRFLEDFNEGRAQARYQAQDHPELDLTPAPMWELVDFKKYLAMPVQFSRGCPFDCEFCDIVSLLGRRPRYKGPAQAAAELDSLYGRGWRGRVDIVDDNFIGNRKRATAVLTALIDWQQAHGYPFSFSTEASIDLADDPDLLSLFAEANFHTVFVGIETPSADSLVECQKRQNQKRDLVSAVKTIQGYGLDVKGGFIVGFDADPPTIFDDQARFIEQAGIPTAMVGLLSAGPGTRLYQRLDRENRLLGQPTGNNALDEGALNFLPKMGREKLLAGYRALLDRLYDPGSYYRRVRSFLKQCGMIRGPRKRFFRRLTRRDLMGAIRLFWRLGVRERGRRAFWSFVTRVGLTRPTKMGLALSLAATGYHLRSIVNRFARTAAGEADPSTA
jgi:radical SAM superfamily enzyme YgiQ (UPF0313 family)